MPQTIGGVVHYHFPGMPVIDSTGDPVEDLAGIQVFLPGSTTPLTVREFSSQAEVTSISSGTHAFIGSYWIPIPDGQPLTVMVDHTDDGFPAQAWQATAEEQTARAVAALIDPVTGRVRAELLPSASGGPGGSAVSIPSQVDWSESLQAWTWTHPDGTTRTGRPPTPEQVEWNSDRYPDAGDPSTLMLAGDVWWPHKSVREQITGAV